MARFVEAVKMVEKWDALGVVVKKKKKRTTPSSPCGSDDPGHFSSRRRIPQEREGEHVMPSGYVRLLRLDIDTHTTREEKKKKKKVNFPFSWLEEQMKLSSLTGFTQRHTKRDGQIRSKRRK
jgi:hypothetical protein